MVIHGWNGHKFNATLKDVHFAITTDELASKYQQAIHELKASIDDSVSELLDEAANQSTTLNDGSDPEEIGNTHTLSLGDQVEVF